MNSIVTKSLTPKAHSRRLRAFGANCKALLYGLGLLCLSATTYAASIHWPDHEYGYASLQSDSLGRILKDFSNNYGYQSVISNELYQLEVTATLKRQAPQSFLEELSGMYGFHWYYDGAAIYYYSAHEMATAVIRLAYLTPDQLKTTLIRGGIWDNYARSHWHVVAEQNLVRVSGPPRMVELIRETVAALDVNLTRDEYQIRIFKLKYSSAADIVRSDGSSVPGVVSMLKRMVENTFEDVIVRTPATDEQGLPRLQGIGRNTHTVEDTILEVPASNNQASIEADVRMNAVIIYDKSDRMAMYEQFIDELDKPVKQVEIQVSILNIKTETLQTLGVNWRLGGNNAEAGFGAQPGNPGADQLGLALGGNLTSGVLSSQYLLATVDALTTSGDANVISRPSVVTSDNLEAQLDFTDTFYVRVTSRESSDLFPVTVGAILKITPHIVDDNGRKSVRMNIDIEDGSQTDQSVEGIPKTQTTSVVTQAVVGNGESIVVGGYYYDTLETGSKKVPGLHHIPVLGSVFKSKTTKSVNMSRVFMITPRIIDLEHQQTY